MLSEVGIEVGLGAVAVPWVERSEEGDLVPEKGRKESAPTLVNRFPTTKVAVYKVAVARSCELECYSSCTMRPRGRHNVSGVVKALPVSP